MELSITRTDRKGKRVGYVGEGLKGTLDDYLGKKSTDMYTNVRQRETSLK